MTNLDSFREMLAQAHEAEGLPAEVEVRLPLTVVLALHREAMKDRTRWTKQVVIAGPNHEGPYPWIRMFEDWGALLIRPLEEK